MKRIHRVAILVTLVATALAAQDNKPSKAANLFDEGMNALIGSEQYRDPVHGVELIRQAAQLGYAPAQTAMVFYSETAQQAFEWCKKAATQGDALGQWCVGLRYSQGNGVSRDLPEAESWLGKAADQGNPFAAYTIGLIKEERDPKAAPAWFQKAAEQGLTQAQQKLGLMLREGRYVTTDKYRAYVWLLVSVEGGAAALAELGLLENDLGSTAVSKAKSEARELARKSSRTANAHGCTGWDGEFDAVPSLPPLAIQKFCR
jgi:TPR repeat protein